MKRKISKTPRSAKHSRKIYFSIAMREKISKDWILARKGFKKTPKK